MELNGLNQLLVYGDKIRWGKTKMAAFKQQSINPPNRSERDFLEENKNNQIYEHEKKRNSKKVVT
jgi:hypothetical protein